MRRGDGGPCRGPHGLHDAGGDHRLLLLHGLAHLPFNDPLHVAEDGLLQAEEHTKLPVRLRLIAAETASRQERKENPDLF